MGKTKIAHKISPRFIIKTDNLSLQLAIEVGNYRKMLPFTDMAKADMHFIYRIANKKYLRGSKCVRKAVSHLLSSHLIVLCVLLSCVKTSL